MERSVAIAAPFIPSPNPKINSGPRTRFAPAPMSIVYIASRGYPEARIMLLRPYIRFIISMPGNMYSIKSRA